MSRRKFHISHRGTHKQKVTKQNKTKYKKGKNNNETKQMC